MGDWSDKLGLCLCVMPLGPTRLCGDVQLVLTTPVSFERLGGLTPLGNKLESVG